MARRRRATAVAAVALLAGLSSCSWGASEPGLLSTPPASTAPAPFPTEVSPPRPTNPRLPVVDQAVWTTADGSAVTVRLAVHAVRRTSAATVLDWSVTPLAGPGRRPGETVPAATDLGLSRVVGGEQNLALLDVAAHRAYRPLANVSRARFNRCLCTPLFAVVPRLRFGDTTVLQLAFPPLPPTTSRVDVAFPNVAVMPAVPVTPVGATPAAASAPVDLARPAVVGNPATGAKTFTSRAPARRQETVVVNRVVAVRGLTSVVWTLHSVDDQAIGAASGPPVSSPSPAGVRLATVNPADGPRLRVAGGRATAEALWTTATFAGQPAYECLCSGLGLWSKGLREGGGSAHLATQVGPLPPGTSHVDVLFPGLAAFTDVRVTWVDDPGPVQAVEPGTDATWTYDEADPPLGWSTWDWPTPLPAPAQVADHAGRPERLLAALPHP